MLTEDRPWMLLGAVGCNVLIIIVLGRQHRVNMEAAEKVLL